MLRMRHKKEQEVRFQLLMHTNLPITTSSRRTPHLGQKTFFWTIFDHIHANWFTEPTIKPVDNRLFYWNTCTCRSSHLDHTHGQLAFYSARHSTNTTVTPCEWLTSLPSQTSYQPNNHISQDFDIAPNLSRWVYQHIPSARAISPQQIHMHDKGLDILSYPAPRRQFSFHPSTAVGRRPGKDHWQI